MKKYREAFRSEIKQIFSDSGVLLIFFVAGLIYPLLYSYVYSNGHYDDMPVAVVDNADCAESRRFIRETDATREVRIEYRCENMAEAQKLMQERKVKGIMMFPRDWGQKIARGETATLSIYCDMSSFFYYKNLLMGANHVMLQEMSDIQLMRYTNAGMTEQEAVQLVQGLPYEENNPYNPTFAYNIFLLSVILLIIIQQTMFYGMSLLHGTRCEKKIDAGEDHILARGSAYFLIYASIGLYIALIVPAIFGILPQRGRFIEIAAMVLLFVLDCVAFSMVWSRLSRKREAVFLLFLFMSPICLFLTGTSWPEGAIPLFWRLFGCLFPSTFGSQAFMNMSTAGSGFAGASTQILAMAIQTIVYFAVGILLITLSARRKKRI